MYDHTYLPMLTHHMLTNVIYRNTYTQYTRHIYHSGAHTYTFTDLNTANTMSSHVQYVHTFTQAHTQPGHIVSHTLASIHEAAHIYVHTCTLTCTHMLTYTSMLTLRSLCFLHSH